MKCATRQVAKIVTVDPPQALCHRGPYAGATGGMTRRTGPRMYLWNRVMTIRPDAFAEGSAAMAETVGYFNANSDYDFTLWQVLLGYPVGSVAVATRFESYGPYTDAMAELNARPETLAATSAVGASLAANPDDSLWQVVHTAGDASEAANVVSNFAWQVDPDQVPASMAWAVEMATFMNGLSGTPVVVGFSQYGEPNSLKQLQNKTYIYKIAV